MPLKKFVRYTGNEEKAKKFPHGNSKDQDPCDYTRTNPDLLEKVATEHGLASKIFRDKQASAPKDLTRHTFDTLRNIEQVSNVQKAERRKFRISHDAFYNLIDMDTEVGTFLTLLQFNPSFIAFGYHAELVEKLRSLIGRDDLPAQCLTYDTTFKLGDFYVSLLVFVGTEFIENPIMPAIYMLHERKWEEVHDIFWQQVALVIPELRAGVYAYIVTDEEKAIVKAIEKNLPGVDFYRCWKHVIADVKASLSNLRIPQAEQDDYVDDVNALIRESSEKMYNKRLLECSLSWNKVISSLLTVSPYQILIYDIVYFTVILPLFSPEYSPRH
jgi:hypothetical protein